MTTRPIDNILTVDDVIRTANHLGNKTFSEENTRLYQSRPSQQIKTTSPNSGYFIMSNVKAPEARTWQIYRYEVTEYVRPKDNRICDRMVIQPLTDEYPNVKAAKSALRYI